MHRRRGCSLLERTAPPEIGAAPDLEGTAAPEIGTAPGFESTGALAAGSSALEVGGAPVVESRGALEIGSSPGFESTTAPEIGGAPIVAGSAAPEIGSLAADQAIIDGTNKNLALLPPSFNCGKTKMTPQDVVTVAQGRIATGKAVIAAEVQRSAAVQAD